MKTVRKLAILLLILIFSLQPVSSAWSQLPDDTDAGRRDNTSLSNDQQRSKGESFGSAEQKDGRKPPDPSQPSPVPYYQDPMGFRGLTYQVHLLGEVAKPGTYRLNASTRLVEALQIAGGIVERGSERRIQIRRQGGGGREVDLLAFKIFGNLDANPYLLDNDVIFVPLRQRVIQVEGSVKRPGAYELRGEKNLQDALKLAGGFSPGIDGNVPLKVVRFVNGRKQVIDIDPSDASWKSFRLEGADVIVVPHILTESKKFDYNVAKLPGDNPLFYPSYEDRVFVLGAVARPGPYSFSPYYDARQYLTLAGGTTKMAKPKKIKVVTSDGRTMKVAATTQINPGDTIIVPEKALAPETLASLILSTVAVTVTALALVLRK